MPISEQTYQRVALEDPEGHWELHCGYLLRKPDMTFDHNQLATRLLLRLAQQLDESEFHVRANMGHVRRSSESYYIPDVFVIPVKLAEPLQGRSDLLEVYSDPLPLVVEVWSPSTGRYDLRTKLLEYQRRGDLEIWYLHPYERTLIAWRRQPDGSYRETLHRGGAVRPVALPAVAIDLDTLFG